ADQPLVLEQLPGLLEREVVRRHDRIRGAELLVGQPSPVLPHGVRHPAKQVGEPLLVTLLDRLAGLLVEVVESLCDLVVHLELTFTHQSHDHCWSSFCFSPGPSSAFIFSSSSSTCDFEASAP